MLFSSKFYSIHHLHFWDYKKEKLNEKSDIDFKKAY